MDNETTSLETILNETPTETEPVVEPVTEAPAEAAAEVTEPDKVVEPTDDGEKVEQKADEPTSPEVEKIAEPEVKTVPLETVIAERRKRQELEARIAQMEQQRNEVPAPDPIEDPEAFVSFQDQKRQAERLQDRIAMSEQLVRTQVGEDEYVKAETAFADEVQRNPALAVELRNHPNPAKFAYDTGKAALDRQEIGDPREFAAKQVAEALAKQEASIADTVAKQVQEQLEKFMPKSLADNASAETRSTQTPAFDGPTPLSSIIPE